MKGFSKNIFDTLPKSHRVQSRSVQRKSTNEFSSLKYPGKNRKKPF
jgi:hypothetical protein